MKGTFEFKLRNGSICTIEATYECVMQNEVFDADGDKIIGELKPTEAGRTNMVAYVDGKKIDSCWNSSSWGLIDVTANPGVKKIWGLEVGFANPEDAERYEKWIAEIIDGGKSDEVKIYEKAEKEKKIKKEVDDAKKTIAKAESQKDIPTREEAKMRMKQYNDFMNEGGEGYVPYIISVEEYENAKEIIKKYGN